MSRSGQVLTNPVTGERAVVRVGNEDGGDPEHAVVDLYVEPGGAVAGEHVHPDMFERFEVLAGTVGLRVDGEERTAGPGEAVEVPPGTPHDWWNAGEEVAHVQVDVRGATIAASRICSPPRSASRTRARPTPRACPASSSWR